MSIPDLTFAFVTAGVSISVGAISLFIGFRTRSVANLTFGLMAIMLASFLFIPPLGFIQNDHPPYTAIVLIKRLFIFSYYALFPWFIMAYTGYGKKLVPYTITPLIWLVYGIMFFTVEDRPRPIWAMGSLLIFASIFLYGLLAGVWQYRTRDREKALWFLLAIGIYGVLFMLTLANQLGGNIVAELFGLKIFFSIHTHALFFMLIMGGQIVADVFDKYKLEKALQSRDRRLQSFMQHAPVFVLELDKKGNVTYVNEFGVHLLGYESALQVLQRNWFDNFLLPADSKSKSLFLQFVEERKSIPYFKNTILSRNGKEISMDWVNFLTFSDDGEVYGVTSVGKDLTDVEHAHRLNTQLKLELEKEQVLMPEAHHDMPKEIIGSSKALSYAIQKARQVAGTQAPVLLEGETGVGKDLLADFIHQISSRSSKPLIKVNCGALPKDLIEDELFGHEKGAFTSAIQARKGRFELADGATIFLDEIGELPLEMQPKLLRVLQSGEFERIGGQQTLKVDVRVIAATNRNLAKDVQQGRFRDDLFYRLNVFPITIPPLRKRKEDLKLLINYFIAQKSELYSKKLDHISKADLQRLMDYSWPGNIRELKNVIERSVIASEGPTLKLEWPRDEVTPIEPDAPVKLEHVEKEHILKIMEECNWKINGEDGAAEKLDMHPNTLRSKMKKLGVVRPVKALLNS